MKIKHLLFILFVLLFNITNILQAQSHVVKKGETVYAIASKYGVSVQDIYTLNPSAEKGIKEGESLRVSTSKNSQTKSYTVKAKETLYSISRANNVSLQELLDVNPGLTAANLQEGRTIRVPAKPVEHKVEKKETLYGIARSYGVTEQALLDANPQLRRGLKKDMMILIPAEQADIKKEQIVTNKYQSEGFPKTDTKTLRIGVFLPFANESDAHKARYVEYYRGFLLAVQEMKAKGYSLDIYAFDIDNATKMKVLLESDDIKDLHLIIGGVADDEVLTLANYTKRNNIKYVIPFPIKDQSKLGSNCFVVSQANQALEQSMIEHYVKQSAGKNTIFIKDNMNNNKEHFAASLESNLKEKGRRVYSLNYSLTLGDELPLIMSDNSVIVPLSSSQTMLSKLASIMKVIKEKYPEKEVSLFGYPDWQAYAQQQSDMKTLNATIYSSFFFDESSSWVKDFTAKYEKWYTTPMLKVYPRYGVLGYDTGIYFLTALARYGFDLEKKITSADIPTLQTTFQFTQSKSGSYYINDGLYLVQYSEYGIKKEKYNQ